jgi:hypothetical protein
MLFDRAERLLEFADAKADGRLRKVATRGHGMKTAEVSDPLEDFELIQGSTH